MNITKLIDCIESTVTALGAILFALPFVMIFLFGAWHLWVTFLPAYIEGLFWLAKYLWSYV